MSRNLTNTRLSYCSRRHFPGSQTSASSIHRLSYMKRSLRVKIVIIFSSIQLSLSLHYNIFVSPASTYTYYICPSYYVINPRLLKQELFSALNKSIRPWANQIKGFQHITPPTWCNGPGFKKTIPAIGNAAL